MVGGSEDGKTLKGIMIKSFSYTYFVIDSLVISELG